MLITNLQKSCVILFSYEINTNETMKSEEVKREMPLLVLRHFSIPVPVGIGIGSVRVSLAVLFSSFYSI
jgi:hypothetical protein